MYSKLAVFVLNTVIAFVLLNAALYPFFPTEIGKTAIVAKWYEDHRWLDKFSDAELAEVYPGLTRSDAEQVMTETAVITSEYEPFAEFKPSPVSSKHMNVSPHGFRSIGPTQAPWPPKDKFTVFVFGGSTTFGNGIADDQTIPAHIQSMMPHASVYNFGAGAYFSTQERIRFEQLLFNGHVPNLAIFVDGLNEFIMAKGETALTPLLRNATNMMNEYEHRRDLAYGFQSLLKALPIWRAAQQPKPPTVFGHDFDAASLKDPALIEAAISRYLANKRLIEAVAKAHNVETLFVWQPIPFYGYAFESRMTEILGLLPSGSEQAIRPKYGYPVAERIRNQVKWCADIQTGVTKLLYIDHVHYSGPMSRMVAECAISGRSVVQ